MTTTHPDEPHDSRKETRDTHAREEAAQSLAEVIAEPFKPASEQETRATLWPTLRDERGLWDGPAHAVTLTTSQRPKRTEKTAPDNLRAVTETR